MSVGDDVVDRLAVGPEHRCEPGVDLGSQRERLADLGGVDLAGPALAFDGLEHGSTVARVYTRVNTQHSIDWTVNPILKDHQKAIVRWAIEGGRRAIFAAFGEQRHRNVALHVCPLQFDIVERLIRRFLPRLGGQAMTKPNCGCPFTAGYLLALGAIAEVRSRQDRAPDGARRLAELCFEHAAMHPTPKTESEPDA